MNNRAYTLMEILIVVSILAILGTAFILLYNPITQMQRTRDITRKNDLAMIKRAIEDFYNDEGRYPKAVEICYDGSSGGLETRIDSYGKPARICHICSNKMSYPYANFQTIPALRGKSICDPNSNNSGSDNDYLYDFDNSDMINAYKNISWVRIYTHLQYLTDHSITEVECQSGCGPDPYYAFNYGVTSNNVDLERKTSHRCGSSTLYQFDDGGHCNVCRGSGGENNCSPTKPIYDDPGGNCLRECQL